jgi:hypothetical protein
MGSVQVDCNSVHSSKEIDFIFAENRRMISLTLYLEALNAQSLTNHTAIAYPGQFAEKSCTLIEL